jgi:transposase
MEPMGRRSRYPQELRERAVRMVQEHRDEYPSEWATITSIAGKLGVGTEALRLWLRRAQVDEGERPGLTNQERERLKQLERENRELRRANEILKAASAFFARELDPRLPRS